MKIRAEFFDIFGFIAFVFLFIVGYYSLTHTLPIWQSYIIIIISALGIIVDGAIVFKTYIKN